MSTAYPCRIFTILLCCLLGGCVFDTPPGITVQQVGCTAVGTGDPGFVELGIDLLLETPTEEPIQLETFEYTFATKAGSRWTGQWSALRTLPAGDSVAMQIPAVIPDPFLPASEGTNWTISGTVSYKAPGRWAQILFDTGFRRPKGDFRGKGTEIAPLGASMAPASTAVQGAANTPQTN